jgi:hypothetical protein
MNYPKKPIKTIIISLSLLLVTFLFATNTLVAAETTNLEQDAGPYHVILENKPENLIANEAETIIIIVKNKATGQAVVGAKVIMKESMMDNNSDTNSRSSNMSGMDKSSGTDTADGTVMHEQSTMDMEPGTYMADITFKQAGQWDQSFSIDSSLGQSIVNFPISVGKSGPNFVLIGIVASLVVIAGIIASIIKKKKYAETGGTL